MIYDYQPLTKQDLVEISDKVSPRVAYHVFNLLQMLKEQHLQDGDLLEAFAVSHDTTCHQNDLIAQLTEALSNTIKALEIEIDPEIPNDRHRMSWEEVQMVIGAGYRALMEVEKREQ